MATKTFDAVVVGAGVGGYPAAIRLAQLGKKVALVEKGPLGGVCLNWGCIPSKAIIAAANLVDEIRGAAERGILAGEPKIDLAKLREFKAGVVKKLVGGVGLLEKGNGVEVVKGRATFVGPNAIEVDQNGEKTRIEAQAFVVATGARPIEIPGFKYDGKDVWGAAEALDLPEIPKRLVCIGGGVIGMELGTAYAKLGSQVTFLEALPQILAGVDPEAVRFVSKNLRQHGVTVHVNAKAKGYEKKGGALVVQAELDGKATAIECDKILVACGFRPTIEGLGLDKLGVKLGPNGGVEVDQQYRTSVPSIFAVGDVVGAP
ncbi:MAG TPA: FAD-dependent oxidoreductase, partial [Anaeromyxobacter sp.]|nr:FAD-dependent oxidoreductase [Anaeromyxobacter sp.]